MNPPGISIIAYYPKWNVSSETSWDLTSQLNKYSHTIEALGGFWSCQFTIEANEHMVNDWIQGGLGRHIEVFDDTLSKIWEGFVDKVTVSYGPLAATRGPLMDIANRVAVAYTAAMRDDDGNTVVGACAVTEDADDDTSQDLWAIIPKILSTGGVELADAELIRDTYLEQHKMPKTSKEIRSGASDKSISITVDCLGYVHWLNWPYNSFTTGVQDADEKIVAVLGDSPNATWLDFDTAHVDANTMDVLAWEADDNLAWNVIKDVVSRGDTSYGRWLFGIYEDMNAYYHAAPTHVYYRQRLSQPRAIVETVGSDEVYPWKVRPGQWLIFPDFLVGRAPDYDLKDDPRTMFIESVKFTAPWGLQLRGGDLDTVEAIVAQLGLSGISA